MGRIKRHFRLRFGGVEGKVADLNAGDGLRCFFHEPKGLGLEPDVKYSGNNGGFFQRSEDHGDGQAEIAGTLVFVGPDPEKAYRQLAAEIVNAAEIELAYTPGKTFRGAEKTEYWRRVELGSLEKTEREKNGWLRCPVKLYALTPWYTTAKVEMTVDQSGTDPFIVGDDENGVIGVDKLSVGSTTGLSGSITPEGELPTALTLETGEMPASVEDPVITVTRQEDGAECGQCALTGYTLPVGAVLAWSTEPFNSYIRAGDTDLLPYADLNHDPFPRLQPEETYVISVTANGTKIAAVGMDVTAKKYYRVV